jgi:G patch domain and KOW motifs-containing protein
MNADRVDESNNSETATTATTEIPKQPFLQLKRKKRPRLEQGNVETSTTFRNGDNVLESDFFMDSKSSDKEDCVSTLTMTSGPLIIPVPSNQLKRKTVDVISHDVATIAAIRALHDEVDEAHVTASTPMVVKMDGPVNRLVKSDSELLQYQQDLQSLPAALDESAEEYRRVPIEEFGAALLRGMGWNEHDDSSNDQQHRRANDDTLPRPHRLGLGAIPATALPDGSDKNLSSLQEERHRPRRIDQYKRDQNLQQQNESYRVEREKFRAADLQKTMQDRSIVRLTDGSRARILKLVGVPGLNMVQIQCEGYQEPSVIKRKEIDILLTHAELTELPFREISHEERGERQRVHKNECTKITEPDDTKNKNSKSSSGHQGDDKLAKRHRKEGTNSKLMDESWVIPNIRVRIVTEKLGRRFYKEKGVVIDVTREAGVTLELSNRNCNGTPTVKGQIPERYLETALPKLGGNVIVLRDGTNKYAKGRLLERDSKKGIVQLYDDMHCITISLDDIAEWCGPLDDDEMEIR